MATFLELAKAVRMISGMQGTGPSSVTDVQGVEAVLVRFIKDAYIDIQNLRDDWKWMEGSQSFTTVPGKDTYTPLDIFGTTVPKCKKFNLNSFVMTDSLMHKVYLKYIEKDTLDRLYLNDVATGICNEFSQDHDSIILKPVPNGAFTVAFKYQKVPEILTTESQVPLLPYSFHNLILYKALEKMSVYLGSPEIYRGYSLEAAKVLGQLMRDEVPKKRRMGRRPLA